MSEHSNVNRTAAELSLKSSFPLLLNFLSSPTIGSQLERQGQKLNVREVVKLYGYLYGTDLDLSNVIIGGQKE